jgi:hypothetical protein
VRFGAIWQYVWPSGIRPRVAEPTQMLINPHCGSAPLEEVRFRGAEAAKTWVRTLVDAGMVYWSGGEELPEGGRS